MAALALFSRCNKAIQPVPCCACLQLIPVFTQRNNSNRAAITREKRYMYVRQFPTMVVNPDGSTFTVRYHVPRKIITLPMDLSTLSDMDKMRRLKRREPKQKVEIEEEIDDLFDKDSYSHLWKN